MESTLTGGAGNSKLSEVGFPADNVTSENREGKFMINVRTYLQKKAVAADCCSTRSIAAGSYVREMILPVFSCPAKKTFNLEEEGFPVGINEWMNARYSSSSDASSSTSPRSVHQAV